MNLSKTQRKRTQTIYLLDGCIMKPRNFLELCLSGAEKNGLDKPRLLNVGVCVRLFYSEVGISEILLRVTHICKFNALNVPMFMLHKLEFFFIVPQ